MCELRAQNSLLERESARHTHRARREKTNLVYFILYIINKHEMNIWKENLNPLQLILLSLSFYHNTQLDSAWCCVCVCFY